MCRLYLCGDCSEPHRLAATRELEETGEHGGADGAFLAARSSLRDEPKLAHAMPFWTWFTAALGRQVLAAL